MTRFVKLIRLAAAGALLAQAGLPSALAQGWAWASMLRSGQTVAQAVGGENPCALCLKIRSARPAGVMAARAAAPLDWQAIVLVSSARLEAPSRWGGGVSVFSSFDPLIADPPPPRIALS